MGYYTRLKGSLDVSPAIPVADVDPKYLNERSGSFWFTKEYNGLIYGIEIYDGEFKAYHVDDEIQEIVSEVASLGSKVNGTVEGFGEDPVDIWRFIVKNNDITKETAEIRWPDGTRVESGY